MMISKEATGILIDLIENKLSTMHVGDREDFRDMVALQRCLAELQGLGEAEGASALKGFESIPRRGRRRKVVDMLDELAEHRNTA